MPPVAASKRPALSLDRAREGAAHVAEQLALEQVVGERRAVDAHERAVVPAGSEPWIARATSSLPGAGLAGDQHGRVGVGHAVDHRAELAHRAAAPDQIVSREPFIDARAAGARSR